MKPIIGLLFTVILFTSYAQTTTEIETTKIEFVEDVEHSNEWEVYLSELDYKIEYRFIDCDPPMGYDQEMVIFRFTNRTNQKIVFNWHILSDYNGVCKTCNYPDEYGYGVTLEAHEEKEGSCSLYEEYNLKVFSKFIDVNYTKGEQLSGFQLGNMTLTKY